MIKVLDKSFAILETVIIASPQPVRVSELAARFSINAATCTRILRQLLDAGYVHQVSRQSGYTAGPRALAFAQQVVYQQRLLDAARPILEEVSAAEHASLLLCERRGAERYILCHVNGCEQLDIRLNALAWRDLFDTATGLMLTAIASDAERRTLIAAYGPEAYRLIPAERLPLSLQEIRVAGGFTTARGNQGIAACVVNCNHLPVAVLGGSLPVAEYLRRGGVQWLNVLRQAAGRISQRISYINRIG